MATTVSLSVPALLEVARLSLYGIVPLALLLLPVAYSLLAAKGHPLRSWEGLAYLPGGLRSLVYSCVMRWVVNPFSASIGASVVSLSKGKATVAMRESRGVRNPFASIHAGALCTLGETASGLAVLTSLPKGVRAIPTGLASKFIKKARGRIVATASYDFPTSSSQDSWEEDCVAQINDSKGDLVCTVSVQFSFTRRASN